MKEINYDELNKITGGNGIAGYDPNGVYNVEIKEAGGRKMMYVYDQDGKLIMIKDVTPDEGPAVNINPEIYQDYKMPEGIDPFDLLPFKG